MGRGLRRAFLASGLLLVGTSATFQEEFGRISEGLRAEGRFLEAMETAQQITDPAERARACLLTAWEAGDLGGALRTGLDGLEATPMDLELLWMSLRLSHALSASELAGELQGRLDEAISGAPELVPETRKAWQEESGRLGPVTRNLIESSAARQRSLWLARWTVLAAFLGLGALALGVSRSSTQSS